MPPAADAVRLRSPYELVLGDDPEGLHPRLRAYFGAIPAESTGHGAGSFDTVGTPRRWFWPLLRLLGRQGVLFAAWQHDVPFTVTNRPIVDDRGHVAVAAVRRFALSEGDRDMIDAITAEPDGDGGFHLVDHLGKGRRYIASLEAQVENGALRLDSDSVALRLGTSRLRLPRFLAPRVSLVERFDDETGRQHVDVVLSAPLIGRLYEYSGSFDYEIRPTIA